MTIKQIHLSVAALALTTLVIAAAPVQAQTSTDVNYQWTAPTTGSPAVGYVVEHRVDGGAWSVIANVTAAQYTLVATFGQSHEIRVAGVDTQGRQGLWSEASDPFTPDAGAPGEPGKPIIF